MNRIRSHIPPTKPVKAAVQVQSGSNAIEAAILKGVPTCDIMATLGASNAMIQSKKRKLRNMGKL